MADIRRQTAYKCSVEQLSKSKYVQQQGLQPNYLAFCGLKVARINLIAVLVSKEGNSLTVDDGSGQVQIMLFEGRLKNLGLNLGDLLLVIAKPREYNDKRFLVPEIIKVLNNHKWLDFRKKELSLLDYCNTNLQDNKPEPKEVVFDVLENYQEKILSKIKELDKGPGAPYEDLISSLNMKGAEEKIQELIKEGEIFEIKGKLKIL